MDARTYISDLGRRARLASRAMAASSTQARNAALGAIADALIAHRDALKAANQQDLDAARSAGRDEAFIDRLTLSDAAIDSMVEGLHQVAGLADPLNEIRELRSMPSGIRVGRMQVPLGVVGIIYESRPNVTIDAAALCLKSGNATILRGGSEALQSNRELAKHIAVGLQQAGLTADAVLVVDTADREAVGAMISDPDVLDVIVPRGGKSLIERITAEARVPVIKHLDGICHVYIDDRADPVKAVNIAVNAKTQRYGTCNTMETLLIAEAVAVGALPELGKRFSDKGVALRGCPQTLKILMGKGIFCTPATEEDWRTEYLAPILSIRVVPGLDAAIEHINTYGSQHTDAIVTEDYSRAMRFLREVDSASVMVNASTRFADGFEYGLGAEIGISTNKLHARGPVGLEGLTTYKWVVLGNGEVRI